MTEGRIVKALSGFYYVQANSTIYACKGRGVFRNQKITPLVGDFVIFDITENKEGYITKIKPRKNEFTRPPIANVTRAVIVSAVTQPSFSSLLLDRFLVLAESKKIEPMIIVTKKDLASSETIDDIYQYQQNYEQLRYQFQFLSLESEKELLSVENFFKDEVTVLMGQTGVGKSTLLNVINPDFAIETAEISAS